MAVARGLLGGMSLDGASKPQRDFITFCPLMASIAKSFGGVWPQIGRELLRDIITLCDLPFSVPSAEPVAEELIVEELQFWQTGQCYPKWPRIRQAKQYPDYYTKTPTSGMIRFFVFLKQ